MTAPAVTGRSADPLPGARMMSIGPEHEVELARLFQRNADPATAQWFDAFALTAQSARAIAAQPRRDLYLAAERDGELLALTMLRGWDAGYEIPSFGILVDRDQRRRGLGRRMTVLTVERAWAAGCPRVRLSVYESNSVARRLYESLGFREAERAARSVAGRPDARIVMTLDESSGL